MIELPGDITREDIKDTVEAILDSRFWNEASRLGVDVKVTVDNNYVPHVEMDTNDDNIRVRVTTNEIARHHGEVVGWEFVPRIINASMNESFFETDDIVSRFEHWARIAKLAEMLYQVDFIPDEYFD